MNLKRDIFIKCTMLKRKPIFWILYILNFFILAICDNKRFFVVNEYDQFIYRCVFQQVFIIFTFVFMIHLLFNEEEIKTIKNYKIIYTKSVRHEIKSYVYTAIVTLIVGFVGGQLVAFTINILMGGKAYIELWLVNMIVVIMQISAATLFIIGLRMLLIKDIVVYGIYYVWIFASLILGNVYISIPLTISIVGTTEQGYYFTFGKELWLGRVLLIILGFIICKIGIRRLECKFSDS